MQNVEEPGAERERVHNVGTKEPRERAHPHLGEGTWPFPTNGQDFAVIGGRSRS
jgi:hypothetical protein